MDKFIAENRELFAAVIGGLIGVFGSVSTIIVDYYLRVSGKTMISLTYASIKLTKSKHIEEMEPKAKANMADGFDTEFSIDIYNSSDSPRSLVRLQLDIRPKFGNKFSYTAPLRFINKENSSDTDIKDIRIVSLPPKQVIHLDFKNSTGSIGPFYKSGTIIFNLISRYPNGKKLKYQLYTLDLRQV